MRDDLVWVATDHYSLGGLEFSVRSTDLGFLTLLREYLEGCLVSDGPETVNYQVDCGKVRTLPGGKVLRPTANLYLGRLRIYCGLRWEDMAGRLIASVRDMLTRQADEFVRIRAAAVVAGGSAVLLPSSPHPQLPTMAALLTRSGADYLGDEVVYLDPILHRAHGVGLPLLLDAADLALVPDLAGGRRGGRRATGGDEEPDARSPRRPIPISRLGGVAAPAPIGSILFPTFRPGQPTRLEALSQGEAVFRLMQAMLNAHVWGERGLLFARTLVERVPVARLVIGSLHEGAALVMDDPAGTAIVR